MSRGTTFRAKTPLRSGLQHAGVDAGRVLVVDDESLIGWSIEQTLSTAGYRVRVAESVAEGLACFETFCPDVVFLDVCLPDGDGLAVLRRMKEQRPVGLSVVVMTAHNEAYDRAVAGGCGADACLKKPFDFETLEELVGRLRGSSVRL